MLFSLPLSPQAMHIPDGFLSVGVSALFGLLSAVVVVIALRQVRYELGERQVPLMGVLAAAIFAGQMLNFAVVGGTSGHLLGATLAVILLGPWPAVLVMTSVVAVQALLFQDGGLLALGANTFNMAVVGVFSAYSVFRLARKLVKDPRRGILAGGFAAAWTSIVVSSMAAALQLVLSGTSPANIAVPAMAGIHALIGLGEALITSAALAFFLKTRPDLLAENRTRASQDTAVLAGGAALVIALLVLSPLASTHPDGLEWVAAQNGFIYLAKTSLLRLLPGYSLPGIHSPALATAAAGLLGSLLVFGVAFGLARAGKRTTAETQR